MRKKKKKRFSQGTASVLLLANEKCGERERLRSVFQQIQQKTKDVLCSPYAHALRPVTKWWDAVKAPGSSCCITGSATSPGPWREVFCETRGEEGGTARLHSPPALHSGGEHCQRLILGRRSPSLLLEEQPRSSLRAMTDILDISQVQIAMPPVPPVPAPCHAQVCPSQVPSLDSVWGCRWIWNCVTSLSQVFSGLGPPAGGALSDRLRNTAMSP